MAPIFLNLASGLLGDFLNTGGDCAVWDTACAEQQERSMELQRQQLAAQMKKNRNLTITAVIAGMLLLMLIGYFILKNKRKK